MNMSASALEPTGREERFSWMTCSMPYVVQFAESNSSNFQFERAITMFNIPYDLEQELLGIRETKTLVVDTCWSTVDEDFDDLDHLEEQPFVDLDGHFNPLFEASNAH